MLDEQDPAAPFGDDPLEHRAEPGGLVAVETGRGLVEQQDVERAGQAARQLDQPSLPRRERAGLLLGEMRDAAQLERVGARRRACADARAGDATTWPRTRAPAVGHSLPRATLSNTVSESQSSIRWNVRPRPRRALAGAPRAAHVVAVQQDPALDSAVDAAAGVERGGLAGAVRTDESGDAAERRVEPDVVDRDQAPELNGEVLDRRARSLADPLRFDRGGDRRRWDSGADRGRPRRPNTAWSRGDIAGCPPCRATMIAKKPNSALRTFGVRSPWMKAGITAVMPAKTAYHGSLNGARASIGDQHQRVERLEVRRCEPSTLVSASPYITPAMPAMKAEMQNTMILVTLVDSPSVDTAVWVSDMPRSTRPSRDWEIEHDDDRRHDERGEHDVVAGVTARAPERRRHRARPGEREEHPRLREEQSLHQDAEAERRQREVDAVQPDRRQRHDRPDRHATSAARNMASSHGMPMPTRNCEKATAPMPANIAWHSDTWPLVLTSRPSDSMRIAWHSPNVKNGSLVPTTCGIPAARASTTTPVAEPELDRPLPSQRRPGLGVRTGSELASSA